MNDTNIDEAVAFDHTMSLCNALAKGACLLSLMADDLVSAERFVTMLLERSARDGLPMWHKWAKCYQAILSIKQGELSAGLEALEATLAGLPENRFSLRHTWVLLEYANGLRRAGRLDEGLETIDRALQMCERDEEFWCISEVLRVRGELLRVRGGIGSHTEAEKHFVGAIEWAQRQGALSWELRAAMSLAILRQEAVDRPPDNHTALALVLGRFKEGFATADLLAATALINDLGAHSH